MDTLLNALITHPNLTQLNLSNVNLNSSNIKRLEENTTLKSIQLWEDSVDILNRISELNIERTRGKLPGLIVKPPFISSKEDVISEYGLVSLVDFSIQYPHTSAKDFVKQCIQKGYFSILFDPKIEAHNYLKKFLKILQFEFIYYAAYWHDKHARNQTIAFYLKSLHELLGGTVDMKEKLVVLWEGLSQGLEEEKITGNQLILSNCFLDETTLINGLD